MLSLFLWTLFLQTQSAVQASAGDLATPTNAKERIELAVRTNGLAGLAVAWHVKASYQIFETDGALGDSGTFEEWRKSDDLYRAALHGQAHAREEFGTDHGKFQIDEKGWGRQPLDLIRRLIEHPITLPEKFEKYRLTNHEETVGEAKLPCTTLTSPKATFVSEETYCFAATNAVVLYSTQGAEKKDQRLFEHFASVQRQTFAHDIQVLLAGQLWLKVHVDVVDGIAPAGLDALRPPASAKPRSFMTLLDHSNLSPPTLLKGADPEYPTDAKRQGIQGTVFISGVVGTDGHVTDLDVYAGPRELRDAALACVEKWRFSPAQANGNPTATAINVEVRFHTP